MSADHEGQSRTEPAKQTKVSESTDPSGGPNEAEQVADQIEESENELIDHDPIDVKSESLTLTTHDEDIQKDLNIP